MGVVGQFANDLHDIGDLNKKYFTQYADDLDVLDKVRKESLSVVNRQLGIDNNGKVIEDGFLGKFVNDSSLQRQVKDQTFKSITGQQSIADYSKAIQDLIKGNPNVSGGFERHFNTFAYDTYQKVDSVYQDAYAESIGLTAFRYQGGLIETSRPFCVFCNSKVFLKEEFQELNLDNVGKFIGKPKAEAIKGLGKTWVPLVDLGHHRCRHHKNYISNFEAAKLRSDLEVGEDGKLRKRKPESKPAGEEKLVPGVSEFAPKNFKKDFGFELPNEFWDKLGTKVDYTVKGSGGSFYSSTTNEITISKKWGDEKRTPRMLKNVVVHEYGHAFHFNTKMATDSFIDPKVKDLYKECRAVLLKSDNLKILKPEYSIIEGLKSKYPEFSEVEIMSMHTEIADTAAALTKGARGFGHSMKYWSNLNGNTVYMELLAHCFEQYYIENVIFTDNFPELHALMKNFIAEIFE